MKQNTLQFIKKTISELSAEEYADKMVKSERERFSTQSEYETHMRIMWSNSDDTPLDVCVKRSFASNVKKYYEFVKEHNGFVENGSVFILNKNEKYVSFIYDITTRWVHTKVHYNPRNVDCISELIDPRYFSGLLSNDIYDISKDEADLIEKCNELIKNIHPN